MKFFVHPLIMPFYAFCLLAELERQSFALNFKVMAIFIVAIFFVTMIFPFFSHLDYSANFQGVNYDGLIDIDAPLAVRVRYALFLSVFYLTFEFLINIYSQEMFNIWAYKYFFYLFLLPLWVNVLSGKCFSQVFPKRHEFFLSQVNIAPSSYIGALAGLVLMLGYHSAVDTFWPFVIALLIFALSAMYLVNSFFQRFSHLFYCFAFGFLQAILILALCK